MAKELKPPTRKYYFENTKQPGQEVEFFAGSAPCRGREQRDVLQKYKMKDGETVELTEEMAHHIRSKGQMRPMGDNGELRLDRRFSLHEV